jgi:hypothetical protein
MRPQGAREAETRSGRCLCIPAVASAIVRALLTAVARLRERLLWRRGDDARGRRRASGCPPMRSPACRSGCHATGANDKWRDPGIGMSVVARHRAGGGDHETWRRASSGRFAGPCGSGWQESSSESFSVAGRGYLRFDDGHPQPSSNRKCSIYGTRPTRTPRPISRRSAPSSESERCPGPLPGPATTPESP